MIFSNDYLNAIQNLRGRLGDLNEAMQRVDTFIKPPSDDNEDMPVFRGKSTKTKSNDKQAIGFISDLDV